jgi:hypothetical protein
MSPPPSLTPSRPHHFPRHPIANRQPRITRRRSLVRPPHRPGIKKSDPAQLLISRHMRVPMQQHIDSLWRDLRRDVNQTKSNRVQFNGHLQWPLCILITIPPNHSQARPKRSQSLDNFVRNHISKMPDLVGQSNRLHHMIRQPIMRVRDDGDPQLTRSAHLTAASGAYFRVAAWFA